MDLHQIQQIKESSPHNLMARHFDPHYFNSLSGDMQARLLRIINTGIQNPESQMGAYAMSPDDYETFKPYLNLLICDYHSITGDVNHQSSWKLNQSFDLAEIDSGLSNTSMRVRVGRNLVDYPLPGAMSRADRTRFEDQMVKLFEGLIAQPDFGGSYVSLTPGSSYEINEERYLELVSEHKMFKDMSADPYLRSAGISKDWPYGRGMYCSRDQQFIIWVGEEDQLRIMAMKQGSILNEIFDRLHQCLEYLSDQGIQFATSPTYGAVTSCPTNLGTGLRASLHLPLPKLTSNGADVEGLKPIALDLGLSVRGAGGEHTEAGAGGIVDISPKARLQISEAEICQQLFEGVKALWAKERA